MRYIAPQNYYIVGEQLLCLKTIYARHKLEQFSRLTVFLKRKLVPPRRQGYDPNIDTVFMSNLLDQLRSESQTARRK